MNYLGFDRTLELSFILLTVLAAIDDHGFKFFKWNNIFHRVANEHDAGLGGREILWDFSANQLYQGKG
jgi:hypothetical protein